MQQTSSIVASGRSRFALFMKCWNQFSMSFWPIACSCWQLCAIAVVALTLSGCAVSAFTTYMQQGLLKDHEAEDEEDGTDECFFVWSACEETRE
jgi:hypothetical protein